LGELQVVGHCEHNVVQRDLGEREMLGSTVIIGQNNRTVIEEKSKIGLFSGGDSVSWGLKTL
jgi:hypothetical protein